MGNPVFHLLVRKVAKNIHENLHSKEYYQKDGIKSKKNKKGENLGQT